MGTNPEHLEQDGRDRQRVLSRYITVIDLLFLVAGAAALVIWWRSPSGWWSLCAAAVLATFYVVYKLVRLVLEYRAGVSVRTRRLMEGNYERATRPVAFWWAMGIEAAGLLLGAGVAAVLWAALASR